MFLGAKKKFWRGGFGEGVLERVLERGFLEKFWRETVPNERILSVMTCL